MAVTDDQVKFLKRRYGFYILPIAVVNFMIISAKFYAIRKFGLDYELERSDINYVLIIVLLNIIPILFLRDVMSYRIGYNNKSIFARPFNKFGPLLKMDLSEIDVVDLKPSSDIGGSPQHRSVIVLYRKRSEDGENMILDCRRTNPRQFKDLVRFIHDRCPEALTGNALHYLSLPDDETPHENKWGAFVWWQDKSL